MKNPLARAIGALAALTALVVAGWPPWPTHAQTAYIGPITQTFTSAGSPPIRVCGLRGENAAAIQATGSGPIDAQVSNDGYSWTATTIASMAGAVQAQPFTPVSGTVYQVTPITADCLQIAPDATWSGQTVTVTFKASGAIAALAGGGGGGGGGVQPSPIYTSPVSCATPNCNVTAYQATGTNLHVTIDNTTPMPVLTPGPVLTDGTGAVIVNPSGNPVTVANTVTPIPVPTAPGASPTPAVPVVAENTCTFNTALATVTTGNQVASQCGSNGETLIGMVGPSSPPAANNGVYRRTVDSAGDAGSYVCQRAAVTKCVGVAGGIANTSGGMVSGLFSPNLVNLSVFNTCTSISQNATSMVAVYYASSAAQTGTLSIYNESSITPGCSAGNLLYTRATAGASFYDPWPIQASAGLSYKWTTATPAGNVYLAYL